ncbi:MAG: hypothetical protein J7L69_06075 [Desulfobulbaceae bacterium]|nr:hypothetical protein [Desulfobulbaceae bacterium]
MDDSGQIKRLQIDDSATYRIRVQGYLEDVWSDRLADMTITIHNSEGMAPESILIGKVRDQAELVNVLNGLYELRMPILALELIKE